MPRKDAPSGPISAQAQQDLVSDGIENFELPKSLVTKIAKSALPDNAKLQKETVLSLVKGSTVFINYLAATAHDVAVSKQHKSISASDVLKALEMIEFGDLVERLQNELLVYRANVKTDKKKAPAQPSSPSALVPAPASTSTPESASVASAAAAAISASVSASASAPPRPPAAKGKAKARELGAPFTSAPLGQHALQAQPNEMEVDWEELGEGAAVSAAASSISRAGDDMDDGGEEGPDDLEQEEQEEDEEDEEDEEGDEEVGDAMQLGEKDPRGLDDVDGVVRNGVEKANV
ncbi:hypothetical protein C0992_002068 [Termitomyces sp. T32_za158]|nr:hypothetical protein C0992_002068 [Termitomyces sp. T32_za158]